MSARTKQRAADRARLNAAACQVSLSDWVAMTRRERRRRLWSVRWEARS